MLKGLMDDKDKDSLGLLFKTDGSLAFAKTKLDALVAAPAPAESKEAQEGRGVATLPWPCQRAAAMTAQAAAEAEAACLWRAFCRLSWRPSSWLGPIGTGVMRAKRWWTPTAACACFLLRSTSYCP